MRSTANGGRGLCASTRAPTTPARAPTARKRRCAGSSRAAVGLPARRACARPPRTVGVTPPAAGGGGCGQRPHACAATRVRLPRQPARARASPRANGVRRRLSSARSGCRSSPPRVRTPPRARFGGGVTPPWREGVGVVNGHTRGSEGCTPTGANADGGTVSGGETPSHGPKTKGGRVAVFKENEYVEVPSERLRGATSASTCAQALPCGSHH